jgi:hypothetical protein
MEVKIHGKTESLDLAKLGHLLRLRRLYLMPRGGSGEASANRGYRGVSHGTQLFESQLQLFDLSCEFLRLTPKLHVLQSSDQQLRILDFAFCNRSIHFA